MKYFFLIVLLSSRINVEGQSSFATSPGDKPWTMSFTIFPDSLIAHLGDLKKSKDGISYVFMESTEITIQEWINFCCNSGAMDSTKFPTNNPYFEKVVMSIIPQDKLELSTLNRLFSAIHGLKLEFNSMRIPKEFSQISMLPITGISYHQALKYCEWRTQRDQVDYPTEFRNVYSLPTPQMYEYLMNNVGIPLDSLDENGFPPFHYFGKPLEAAYSKINKRKSEQKLDFFTSNGFGAQPLRIAMFYGNDWALYDIYGNVSEMTNVLGIAKGCNYGLYASTCMRGQDIPYDESSPWLGFRCVMSVQKVSSN